MLIRLFKASGHSMEPEIKNGSFFMASSIPFLFNNPEVGDNIVFKFENKNIVKQIVKIEKDKYFIKGKNLNDSKNFPPIERSEILGKLLWIF